MFPDQPFSEFWSDAEISASLASEPPDFSGACPASLVSCPDFFTSFPDLASLASCPDFFAPGLAAIVRGSILAFNVFQLVTHHLNFMDIHLGREAFQPFSHLKSE